MKWLITGGCGFIGSNLIKNIFSNGARDIRVIDNLSIGSPDFLQNTYGFKLFHPNDDIQSINGLDIISGDILDKNLALRSTIGADIIVHLAANCGVEASIADPIFDCDANVKGTLNYLEAAKENKIKRFIFASSGAPAGNIIPPIHEEIVPKPISPYGASKLSCEGYCSAYKHSFDIDTVVLRFSNVYGPMSFHKNSVVAKFTKEILEDKTLETYGDGKQTRDFIYVDDLVNAIIQSSKADKVGGEVFQIATNKETSINDIIKMLTLIFSEITSQDINVKKGEVRLGDMKRNFSDISKAKEVLKWEPRKHLNDGLKETVEYFLREIRNE